MKIRTAKKILDRWFSGKWTSYVSSQVDSSLIRFKRTLKTDELKRRADQNVARVKEQIRVLRLFR